MQRILDDLRRNNDEHRRLLMELEDIVNSRRRPASPPPARRYRKVESEVGVHVSRVPSTLPMDELVEQFVEMYGAVKNTYNGNNWINIEFVTTASQHKCLEDADFLNKQWGITVAKHIIKR